MEHVHEEIYKDFEIKIFVDEEPSNPREDDNLTTMLFFHRNYILGDKHDFDSRNYDSANKLKDAIIKKYKPSIIRGVRMFDHSGIGIALADTTKGNSYPYSCQWDSMFIGWVIVENKKMQNVIGWKYATKKRLPELNKQLEVEMEVYDNYLQGNVYGYSIKYEDEEIESCWNYIGNYDSKYGALPTAKEIVDSFYKERIVLQHFGNDEVVALFSFQLSNFMQKLFEERECREPETNWHREKMRDYLESLEDWNILKW